MSITLQLTFDALQIRFNWVIQSNMLFYKFRKEKHDMHAYESKAYYRM